MAGRDITIPFGPDRTGAIDPLSPDVPGPFDDVREDVADESVDLSALVPAVMDETPADAVVQAASIPSEGVPASDARAYAPFGAAAPDAAAPGAAPYDADAAGNTGEFEPVSATGQSWNEKAPAGSSYVSPRVDSGEADGYAAGVASGMPSTGDARAVSATPESPAASEMPDAPEGEQGEADESEAIDVPASLVALKDSIDQGRQLKARERERDEFGQRLDEDREELADREDILANYHALVAEQDSIINQNTQQRDSRKAEMAQLVAEQEETSAALERMRTFNDAQLEPLEMALGRAKANAERAKNDERSRKAELNAAESESRKAEGGDAAMASARLEVAKQAFDEASAASASAKSNLEQVQKQYDDMREQIEQAEAPLERSLEDLGGRIDELKESIARLGETISTATKRRQYCDTVYQYPEETHKLRASVEADEQTARRMDEENDELRNRLAVSRKRSMKAKVAIAIVILIAIVVVVGFVVLGNR